MGSPQAQLSRKKVNPNLKDLLDQMSKDIMIKMNCHVIATVRSFDSEKQTITATINWKKTYSQRQPNGEYINVFRDYPILLDVPVICLGGGSTGLTFPIIPGDQCSILFCDRSIDNWFQSGQVVAPDSSRMHSISDGIAIVGLHNSLNPIPDYDTSRASLFNGTTRVGVGADKILLENSVNTLNELLQDLTTELTDLTTQLAALTVSGVTTGPGVSGVPVNAAAITAIGVRITNTATEIEGLLE